MSDHIPPPPPPSGGDADDAGNQRWASPSPEWGSQAGWDAGQPAPGTGVPPGQEGFLETVVGVVTSPVATLRGVAVRRPVGWAIALTVVLGALTGASSGAEMAAQPPQAPPGGPDPTAFLSDLHPGLLILGGALLLPLLSLAGLALYTALVLAFAKMFSGRGGYGATFCGLAFSNVPSALNVVTPLLSLTLGVLGTLLSGLIGLGVGVWTIVLAVLAVREGHGFGTGAAVGAVLLPIAALVIAGVVLAVAVVLVVGF